MSPSLPTLAVAIETPSTAGSAGGFLVFGDATYGKFGTGKFAGPLGNLVDYSSYVMSLNTQRGEGSPSDVMFHAQTGTASVGFKNLDRKFDPASNTDIRPMRSVQITATYNAVTYDVFTGFITDWEQTYPGTGKAAITTAQCADGTIQLVNTNLTGNLPREFTGDRITELLNLCEWPISLRNINPGLTFMPASIPSTSGWTLITEAADSELGDVYVETDGTFVFRDRDAIVNESRSNTSQATFGDGGGGELIYGDVVLSYDTKRIHNTIQVTYNEQGDATYAADGVSQQNYGQQQFNIQASIADVSVAGNIANFALGLYKDPHIRVDSLTLHPARDPANLWPQALGRKISDRITVNLTPPGGGPRISRVGWIRGISHTAAPSTGWTTTFTLQDITQLATTTTFIRFGTTTFGNSDVFFF